MFYSGDFDCLCLCICLFMLVFIVYIFSFIVNIAILVVFMYDLCIGMFVVWSFHTAGLMHLRGVWEKGRGNIVSHQDNHESHKSLIPAPHQTQYTVFSWFGKWLTLIQVETGILSKWQCYTHNHIIQSHHNINWFAICVLNKETRMHTLFLRPVSH